MRLQRTLCGVLTCLASLAAIPAESARWSMYNYDPQGSRYNREERVLGPGTAGGLHVQWTFPTVGAVAATPAVSGSRLYAGDQSGAFHALSTADGHLLWSTQVAAPVTASALVVGRRIVFGDLAGNVYGLDRTTGAIAWQMRPNPHPLAQIYGSATPIGRYAAIGVASIESFATADPTYPCCSARGSVVLFDPRDGRIVWQTYLISDADHAAGASGASVWSSPTYDRKLGLVFVTTGQNFSDPATGTSDAIVALDARTGAIRWVNQRLPNDVWNIRFPQSPEHPDYDIGDSAQVYTLPSGQKVVGAGQKSGFFHVLDAATGALVAVQQFVPGGGNGGLFADSAVANGIVYANGSDWTGPAPPVMGALVAFTGDASQELWRFTVPDTANISGVAVANGVVYFESYNGTLYALDATTGASLAQLAIGAAASGPAVVHGHVYAGTGDPFTLLFTGTPAPGSIVALGP